MARNPQVDWESVDDVILGDANQAGESNRNVARMAALLAGFPVSVPGTTINRLCASGMDAVGMAARGIRAGDFDLAIAGMINQVIQISQHLDRGTGKRSGTRRCPVIEKTDRAQPHPG